MKEYRQRMLASPKSAKVLESIFDAALDDDHKNQAAAWKLIMDRVAPVSGFDKSAGGAARSSLKIEISGVPGVNISGSEEPEEPEAFEAEFEPIDDPLEGSRGDPEDV
jgi:hypothetical protein